MFENLNMECFASESCKNAKNTGGFNAYNVDGFNCICPTTGSSFSILCFTDIRFKCHKEILNRIQKFMNMQI